MTPANHAKGRKWGRCGLYRHSFAYICVIRGRLAWFWDLGSPFRALNPQLSSLNCTRRAPLISSERLSRRSHLIVIYGVRLRVYTRGVHRVRLQSGSNLAPMWLQWFFNRAIMFLQFRRASGIIGVGPEFSAYFITGARVADLAGVLRWAARSLVPFFICARGGSWPACRMA